MAWHTHAQIGGVLQSPSGTSSCLHTGSLELSQVLVLSPTMTLFPKWFRLFSSDKSVVIPSSFHFKMMEATVIFGTFRAAESLSRPLPGYTLGSGQFFDLAWFFLSTVVSGVSLKINSVPWRHSCSHTCTKVWLLQWVNCSHVWSPRIADQKHD